MENSFLKSRMEEVKQFKIFFSNQLEPLAEKLCERLFREERDPFKEVFIVVPTKGVKLWLEQFLARKAIFFGVEILPLDSALKKLMGHEGSPPSHCELTLAITSLLEEEQLLKDPLLAEKLAFHFRRYALYGYSNFAKWEESGGWQETIWKKLFGNRGVFTPLSRALTLPPAKEVECHLFGLSHLPRPMSHFFRKLGSFFYQLSYCESFWSDLLSDREIYTLGLSFEEERPALLANFALVMRKGLLPFEEEESEQEEEYRFCEGESQLERLQNAILAFEKSDHLTKDDSIQIHRATSALREVEIMRNHLLYLFEKEGLSLDAILILAPDITLYTPYLTALLPWPQKHLDSHKKGEALSDALFLFLDLEKKRFSSVALMDFLSHPIVRGKFRFTDEDLELFKEWMERAPIRWGFDLAHKNRLMAYSSSPLLEEKSSFTSGLDRLIASIAEEGDLVKISQLDLLAEFYDLIHQIYKESSFFHHSSKRSFTDYYEQITIVIALFFQEGSAFEMSGVSASYQEVLLSFDQFYSLLQEQCAQSRASFPSSELGALTCASLSSGALLPAKVTFILGLNEECFPRLEQPSQLDLLRKDKPLEYLPSKADFDRGFFLEALFSCQEKLFFSYVETPSLALEEFVDSLASVTRYEHPNFSFDSSYFTSNDPYYRSYWPEEYKVAIALQKERQKLSFPEAIHKKALVIELKELLRAVKSPLKESLRFQAGLFFSEEHSLKEEEEFLLSPLEKAKIVRGKSDSDKGAFPQGTFGQLALRALHKEEGVMRELFESYKIDPKELQVLSLREEPLLVGPYQLVGTIEHVHPRGLFTYEKATFAGMVRAYPAFLALHARLGANELFFGKEPWIVPRFFEKAEPILEKLIELFIWARESHALLLPELIEPILRKESGKVDKALNTLVAYSYDEALAFTFRHQPLPKGEELIETLYPRVSHSYKELYDYWF